MRTDHVAGAWFGLFSVVAVVAVPVAACGGAPSDSDANTPATPSDPSTLAVAPPDPAELQAVTTIVGEMRDPHRCNRLTGCPGHLALMQRGPLAVPALVAIVTEHRRADGYWLEMLIDLLGQLDDARPLPLLGELAMDPRWGIRVAAIRAIGRLARHVGPALAERLAQSLAAAEADTAWQAALHFALARIDPTHRELHHKALAALIPRERAAVEAIPNPMLDVTISLCGEARLPETAIGIRFAALSTNRFVSVTAAQTLAVFRDTGAIPYLLTRLEDPNPGIRRAALAALQEITGNRDETRPDAWRTWAKRYHLDTLPGAPAPSP